MIRKVGSYPLMALGAALTAFLMAPAVAEEQETPRSVHPVLWQQSMNVFRRFEVEPQKMFEFYGDVLGLEQLQTFDVGNDTQVARFMAGRSEVKFTHRVPDRTYVPGGIEDATGLRLLTFFYPDRDEVIERFRAHGHPEPRFEAVAGSSRMTALVTDPDGHAVELVYAPDEPAEIYDTIEVGLTVTDLNKSREFYGEFVGLQEMPEVEDRHGGTKKLSYRHGTTIISLHQLDRELPPDTGTGGIQYVVSNVAVVDELARKHDVTVDQPLSGLPGFDLRTIWLFDPDGITNYFAETGVSRQTRVDSGSSGSAAR